MADYTVTKLQPVGPTTLYETRLADGTASQFVYSGSEADPMYAHWVAISVRRAQRNSDYLRAHRG